VGSLCRELFIKYKGISERKEMVNVIGEREGKEAWGVETSSSKLNPKTQPSKELEFDGGGNSTENTKRLCVGNHAGMWKTACEKTAGRAEAVTTGKL